MTWKRKPREPSEYPSPRERDILRLMIAGRGTGQIADELGIKPSTVWQMNTRLKRRVGVVNDVQLGIWAATHGYASGQEIHDDSCSCSSPQCNGLQCDTASAIPVE